MPIDVAGFGWHATIFVGWGLAVLALALIAVVAAVMATARLLLSSAG